MEIQPNPTPQPAQRSAPRKRASRVADASADEDVLALADSGLLSAIAAGLSTLEEVRQSRVDEGRRLAADPDYPSAKQKDDVCRLAFQSHFRQTDEESDAPSAPQKD